MEGTKSRLERLLLGDVASPLELLVGSTRYGEELVVNAVRWALIVLGAAALAFGLDARFVRNEAGLAVALAVGLLMGLSIRVVGPHGPRLFFPIIAIVAGGMSAVLVWTAGPGIPISVCAYPAFVAAVFLFFNRRTAILASATTIAGYAVVVSTARGFSAPAVDVVFLSATAVATGVTISRLVSGVESLARNERALHAEVAAARAELEGRVTAQVEEIERLGKLRRFLSPQVADTVLSSGDDAMLATHRRQIAVIFLDLRGFTSFSAVAEPEDVVDVLSEFTAVGAVVKRLDATVGSFAGDGVMAYFNDPVPCEDPPGRALDMALSLRDPMALLKDRWRDRGFDIGFGAGIAYGYATLGTIGFEQRTDYTPIGSVVNLASRLCDEAADGEVLLDSRAHTAVRDRVATEPRSLDLKGFAGVVTAYGVRVA